MSQAVMDFQGATFDPALDGERLAGQLSRVYRLMRDGKWRTLREIADVVGGSEAGVSARLRDLRKDEFKSLYRVSGVDRERVEGGLHRYRVTA